MTEQPYRPPTRFDKVPNEPLRERFLKLGLGAQEVAAAVGWQSRARPDHVRVGRSLGLLEDHGRFHHQITYTSAVALCRALDLDPIDAGV